MSRCPSDVFDVWLCGGYVAYTGHPSNLGMYTVNSIDIRQCTMRRGDYRQDKRKLAFDDRNIFEDNQYYIYSISYMEQDIFLPKK